MIEDPAVRLAERIAAIDWTGGLDRRYSRLLLMSEYLRRSAWWVKALNGAPGWPFFDIAERVDPSIRADQALVEQVEAHLAGRPMWSVVKSTCIWALRWTTLRATPGIVLPDLQDPYAPLILMYERGGGFTMSTGYIDIDGAGVRRKTWLDHLAADPVVALDPAVLDAKDLAGPTRRSASRAPQH